MIKKVASLFKDGKPLPKHKYLTLGGCNSTLQPPLLLIQKPPEFLIHHPSFVVTKTTSVILLIQACNDLTPTSPSSRDLIAATAAMLPAAVVK